MSVGRRDDAVDFDDPDAVMRVCELVPEEEQSADALPARHQLRLVRSNERVVPLVRRASGEHS